MWKCTCIIKMRISTKKNPDGRKDEKELKEYRKAKTI